MQSPTLSFTNSKEENEPQMDTDEEVIRYKLLVIR